MLWTAVASNPQSRHELPSSSTSISTLIEFEDSNLSLRIHVLSVRRLRFMWAPSFSLAPSACVCDALSLPARSTKFCNKQHILSIDVNLCFSHCLDSTTAQCLMHHCELWRKKWPTKLATNEVAGVSDTSPWGWLSTVCRHNAIQFNPKIILGRTSYQHLLAFPNLCWV
jgi:hypothetical protein